MRVLVTGACGYTGSVLTQKLINLGHEVTGWDTQWFGNHIGLTDDPRDIRSPFELPEKLDAIVHLAAIANDPSVAYYPRLSWETGVLATMRLCEAAIKQGCRRFVYASSVSVYGADRGEVKEDAELRPLSDYNKTKMAAERVLLSYAFQLQPIIIRPATVCGLSPRMRMDLTVNMLTGQALRDGVMTLHGGQQWRPSIHINDLTDLYVKVAVGDGRPWLGIFNAGFENHTLQQIAERVQEHVGGDIQITEQRDSRSYQVCADKLLQQGFTPRYKIDDAIEEIHSAHRAGKLALNNPQWINLQWMEEKGIPDV
jgi:nucleoside-diphosphate-sugar epimerase